MNGAIKVTINANKLDLPRCPAIYAIFSETECRFIGMTDNLYEKINGHLMPTEKIIPLRYFMQSYKQKLLQYKIFPENLSLKEREAIKEKWIDFYMPSDNE